MIKAVFGGGLGNQMFLYAYIYAQMRENSLNTNIYAIMHRNKNEDKRDFSLKSLNCSCKMSVVDEERTNFVIKGKMFIRKQLFRILKKMHIKDEKIIKIFDKLNICYSPNTFKYYSNLKLKNNEYIEGAFQTWKYFEKYREELIKEFKVSKEISAQNKEILNNINSNNSVCVHIRRGDYVNSHYSKTLQICNYDYYKNAMEYIASKIKNPTFYIFSNSHEDHEWIKQNYKFNYNVINVDLDNPDYEELRLMYSCKHFIISNSTFSWWAQFLSTNKNKEVVAPLKWYKDESVNTEDIYMPNWHVIDV